MTEKPKTSDRAYYLFALRIVGDFGASIAVPAVLAAIIGSRLDEKFGTYPLFVILFLLVAGLLTAKSITKKAKKYGEVYNDLK